MIEMDVSHERNADLCFNRGELTSGIHVGHPNPDDFAAGPLQAAYLANCGLYISGVGGCH
jgi:hypothetical protein